MSYNFLGKSGLKVSNMCLGTVTFGKRKESQFYHYPTQLHEDQAHAIMDRYVELGGNFIDTANNYGFGQAEEIVGNWLQRQDRKKMVIATKVRFCMDGGNANSGGLSRKHILDSCEESLERLKTNYVDLYQAHMWDAGVPLEETLRTFDELIRFGKIRYFGFSNVCGWQLQKIVDTAKYMGLNPCISLQQQYNLLTRYPENEELMVCRNEGLGVLPWSPLKGGLLTGKFRRDERPSIKGSRIGYIHANEHRSKESAPAWSEYMNDETYWNIMEELNLIAQRHKKTVPQVALRWLLQKDAISSVIFGATSVGQLEENMGAGSGWTLTMDEMEQLDSVSAPEMFYPHTMIVPNNYSRVNKCNK